MSPLLIIVESGIRLLSPLLIGYIIRYLSGDDETTQNNARYCVAGIIVVTIVMTFMYQHGFGFASRHGNNLRAALCHLIFKKVIRMSGSSIASTDLGHVLNIIANDLNRFEDLGFFLVYLVIGPLSILVSLAVTHYYIKNAAFTGFVLLIVFVPFQCFMGTLFNKFRAETTVVTDKRVNLMSEILQAMKLIKVYCWESPFSSKVGEIRSKEIRVITKSYFLEGVNNTFFFAAEKSILFACFLTYSLMNERLDTQTVMVVMSVYDALRVPVMGMFPEAIGLFGESLVALGRVNALLLKEETPQKSLSSPNTNANSKEKKYLTHSISSAVHKLERSAPRNESKNNFYPAPSVDEKHSILMEHYSGKWTKSVEVNNLSNISLSLNPGQLLIVVGSVGSSKTCFLYAILNEIEKVSGNVTVNGSISYSAQEAWCFSGSIRQNILLGHQIDETRYQQVIEVCGLERDLTLFDLGDQTFVGEKGHNLSGGQKARVSLARAVYHEADIYLLDDPLSAVDPKIANHIFEKCIKGFLRGKTVILVTHQLQFLSQADEILVLNEGCMIGFGPYSQLTNNNMDFLKFLDGKKKEEEQRRQSLSRQKSLSVHQSQEKDDKELITEEIETVNDNEKKGSDDDDLEEHKIMGAVSTKVFWDYFRSGGSLLFILALLVVSLVSHGAYFLTDLWLAAWAQKGSQKQFSNSLNSTETSLAGGLIMSNDTNNLIVYGCLIISLFLFAFCRMIMGFYLCLRCSVNLHDMIFRRLLRAPMIFFESNPLGRILNRFTRDMAIVDFLIPRSVVELNMMLIEILGIVIVSTLVNPWFLIPTLFLTLCAVPIRQFYVNTGRDLHRLDSMSRSPLYHYMSSTFNGIITIRSFEIQEMLQQQYLRYLNDSVSARFLVLYAFRFFGVILDMFTMVYITCICIVLVETPRGTFAGGDAGLVLSQALLLIGLFQYAVRTTAEFENQMTSSERILEYGKLPMEADLKTKGIHDELWPQEGKISFRKVYLRYSKDSDFVLKDLTFEVKPGEKIGIVGRTGAGKSSLISILFRLVEPEGSVMIDGVDIKSLGLHDLRNKISIIPQDPSLFSGSVRENLDPFKSYQDDSMWDALGEAHLTTTVQSMGGLDAKVTEGGTNLSVGQRQLLCMARALLKKNKILVMDEATANVDQETDDLIQKTIKTTFVNNTVLTVAHRLNTIIDMDKVLVMDAGRVVEFDEPYTLLRDITGVFHSMVKQTGPEFEKMLHSMAERSHFDKLNTIEKRNNED